MEFSGRANSNISMLTRHSIALLLLAAATVGQMAAQTPRDTSIDLQVQAKNPDFSGFPFTRPIAVGATLPSSCQIGQLHFLTSANPGSNLYACTGTNVWTVESGGGLTMAAQLGDFGAVLSSGTLTVGGSCSSATPCNARVGNTTFSISSPVTAAITGSTASDLALIYIDSAGNLTIADSTAPITCTGCTYLSGISQFPANCIPLWSWTIVGGALTAGGGRDYRALLSTTPVLAGTGIQVSRSSGIATVAIDPTSIPTLSGTNAFTGNNTFQNITVSSCTGCASGSVAAVTAIPPYLSIGGTKYIAATMGLVTLPNFTSGWSWVGGSSPTIANAPNGNVVFSGANTYWDLTPAATSVDSVFQCSYEPSGNNSTCGVALWDSTNNLIYAWTVVASPGNSPEYFLFASDWSYSGSGTPSYVGQVGSSYPTSTFAVPDLKVVKAGTALNFQISQDGGQTYTTMTSQSGVGNISAAGVTMNSATMNVLSLVTQ